MQLPHETLLAGGARKRRSRPTVTARLTQQTCLEDVVTRWFLRKLLSPVIVALALTGSAQDARAETSLSPEALQALARDAYLYAYPIVSMEISMRQATNVPDAKTVNMRAPLNQFAHARAYPGSDEKDIVRFNFDTLYSFAWLDVGPEPVIVSVPDTKDRYYLLPLLDMWTDVFAVIGSRTTGNGAGNYAIVASDWSGTLPEGTTKIVAPTDTVWVIGRTRTDGPADYANVHAVQDGFRLTPLSQWGKAPAEPAPVPVDPSVDDKTPPLLQVDSLSGVDMLARLSELMAKHPPHPNDYPLLLRLRALGIEPGKPFDPAQLDADTAAIINTTAAETLKSFQAAWERSGKMVNGWAIQNDNIGTYGTSYLKRALVAKGGLGANLPEDAVYPTAIFDAEGKPLDGANRYVLHFDKGQLPPNDAFWSITMYDMEGFQVPNPIDRFAIGSYDKLAFNADGSLDILVQAETPGADKEVNWLPAPKGRFQPSMRIYSPRAEVLDSSWSPPAFVRQD
jgi:hypothetical protein